MKCEGCPSETNKSTEVEIMTLEQVETYWLCDDCLKEQLAIKGNGTAAVATGRTRGE